MKRHFRDAVVGSALHYGTWLVVSRIVEIFFRDSPARDAYGTLSAWWASLYIGYVFEIGIRAAIPVSLIVVFAQLASLNAITFSTGDQMPLSPSAVAVVAGRCFVLASPILANAVTRAVKTRITRR